MWTGRRRAPFPEQSDEAAYGADRQTAGRASMPPLLHPALPLLLGATLTFRALRRALSRLPLPAHVRADPLRTWRWHNLLVSFAHSIVSGVWALLW